MREFLNIVPLELADEIGAMYTDASWDTVHQHRKGYYAREFTKTTKGIPSHNEDYTASFCRSGFLESSEKIQNAVHQYIMPIITSVISKEWIRTADIELRAYKLVNGGHFRLHKDDYRAAVGFIWYLSKDWKWDWGGLLLTLDNTNIGKAYLPEYNKLVVLDHESTQNAHCVTTVTCTALEPRLMLVGFISSPTGS